MSDGLSTAEARARQVQHGANELARSESRSPVLLFVEQLKSPMIALLAVAAIISGALGEAAEAIAILAIVVLNALVGFVQEFRAEKAVLAMRTLTAPRARVMRDGQPVLIAARDVVPGDVLLLEAGDLVAADARLLEANVLTTIEAALTGESLPVEKRATPSAPGAPLAERHDFVFQGTAIATGTARALVEHIGLKTQLGTISRLLAETTDERTPLQLQLEKVGRSLLVLCLGVVAVVAVLGLLRGMAPLELALSSISLAVAAVPEGLPAIVTIALALGVQRMAARHVLVRRLPSVETLGCTTVICTDKTGTLTTGTMTVREVWTSPGHDERLVLEAAVACCDAELTSKGGVGDPTELALLLRARELSIERAALELAQPRTRVFPFDSLRKRMAIERGETLFVKGAVDLLIPLCVEGTAGALEANAALSKRGLRVLGIARRAQTRGLSDPEQALTLVGLVGLADPPRPEAIEALKAAKRAGIRVVMMTGDHPTTAEAIAREMGLLEPGQSTEGRVFARVTPEDKLRIVREFKAKGEVVAVTGDGTNDAPALKEAHVGVAMGQSGVEVTREAADLVLANDDFGSIIAAVREGRGVYENIRRALVYLLGGNVGELLVTLGASLLGLPLPLLALHLLWVNLVTDGLPALALVMEPTRDDVLNRPPRSPELPMLGRSEWRHTLAVGALVGGVTLLAFAVALRVESIQHARTLAFSVLVFTQLFNAFAFRSFERVSFEVGAFRNPRLLVVVALTLALQLGVVALPFTNTLFDLGPFRWTLMAIALALGLVPPTVLEVWKLVTRATRRAPV